MDIDTVQAARVYEDIKKQLKRSNGKIHTVMVVSFSKMSNIVFNFENKYTAQIEYITSRMQDEGYEIVDIKFHAIEKKGLLGTTDGIYTLIIYR